MKLRLQMVLLGVIPLVAMGIAVYIIGSSRTAMVVGDIVEKDLKAVAFMVASKFSDADGNNYYVDDQGNLWNNDLNITASTAAVDQVKKDSGIVATIFFGDTRYMTSVLDKNGDRVVGTQAGGEVVREVLENGNTYFAKHVDVVGEEYYAYYLPIYNADSATPVGMVFTGMSQKEVEKEIAIVVSLLVGFAVIMMIGGGVLIFIVSTSIVKKLKVGVSALQAVAGGDLTVALDKKILSQKNEIGDMIRAIDEMKTRLHSVVGEVVRRSNEVADLSTHLGEAAIETSGAIEQVEKAVNEVADGATAQAGDTQQATENVIVMGNLVEETNTNVSYLTRQSDVMEQKGNAANDTLKELEKINDRVKSSIQEISEQTNTTNESAKKISETIGLITAIAEETNLLSLNASIEAARAGEQGRGFAVVASQIQKLAEQSNDSAKQIEDIINSLMADSQKAMETMDAVTLIMKQQSEMVDKTGNIFGEVFEGIKESRRNIEMISNNTKGLDDSRSSVVDIVQNLSAIAQENAASTQETSASTTEVSATVQEMTENAKQLEEIADKLSETVKIFKV